MKRQSAEDFKVSVELLSPIGTNVLRVLISSGLKASKLSCEIKVIKSDELKSCSAAAIN